jgi:hypothetical protein
MSKFVVGDCVTVLANAFSLYAPDHQEQPWAGTVLYVSETPARSGVITAYGVDPKDGGLPRDVLEYRLKPGG